jgi:SAM-dependent methyltransferase|tara:strand:+ start:754 stop:1401 length:648 start_codon:yes stop_codon:yes gene_type:complete
VFLLIKRFFASNKYFWKFRHFFDNKIFDKSYGVIPNEYFDQIFENIKIDSVLDYGCATGDKLIFFINRGAKNVFGIDINPKAINTARDKIKYYNVNNELSENINTDKLNKFLDISKIKKFDLIILDRILYILNDQEIYNLFNIIKKITNYIYIDDFFLDNEIQSNNFSRLKIKGYVHTNFDKILNQNSFKLKIKNKSPYQSVLFSNAKSALYEKQ